MQPLCTCRINKVTAHESKNNAVTSCKLGYRDSSSRLQVFGLLKYGDDSCRALLGSLALGHLPINVFMDGKGLNLNVVQ